MTFASHAEVVHGVTPLRSGPVAQLAEQQTLNLLVEGSIPSGLTNLRSRLANIRVSYGWQASRRLEDLETRPGLTSQDSWQQGANQS